MATESVPTPERLSVVDLWPYISQLESLLDVVNDDLITMQEVSDQDVRKQHFNRAHNLLGAAQTVAAELAVKARVR